MLFGHRPSLIMCSVPHGDQGAAKLRGAPRRDRRGGRRQIGAADAAQAELAFVVPGQRDLTLPRQRRHAASGHAGRERAGLDDAPSSARTQIASEEKKNPEAATAAPRSRFQVSDIVLEVGLGERRPGSASVMRRRPRLPSPCHRCRRRRSSFGIQYGFAGVLLRRRRARPDRSSWRAASGESGVPSAGRERNLRIQRRALGEQPVEQQRRLVRHRLLALQRRRKRTGRLPSGPRDDSRRRDLPARCGFVDHGGREQQASRRTGRPRSCRWCRRRSTLARPGPPPPVATGGELPPAPRLGALPAVPAAGVPSPGISGRSA